MVDEEREIPRWFRVLVLPNLQSFWRSCAVIADFEETWGLDGERDCGKVISL